MGWLRDLTDWLLNQIITVWNAFVGALKAIVLYIVETLLELAATVIELIPVPDFIGQYAIGSMLSHLGSDLAWFMGSLRIGEALGLLGLGYAARLVRKALTLGQW